MKSSKPGKSVRVSDGSSCKKAGRPRRLDSESVAELKRLYLSKPYSVRELAEMFEVSRMTVWRAVAVQSGSGQSTCHKAAVSG